MTQEFLGDENTEEIGNAEPVDLDVATETQGEDEEEPEKPYLEDIEKKQEETRGILAQSLIILLAATASAIVGYSVFYSEDKDTSESLLTLVWTSQVGLVGGALGFYFGQNSSK